MKKLKEEVARSRKQLETIVPRYTDDSLAFLHKQMNKSYARAYIEKNKTKPENWMYARLAKIINKVALGTDFNEKRQVMTNEGAIRTSNALIMFKRHFDSNKVDTEIIRRELVRLYGEPKSQLTIIELPATQNLDLPTIF
jgi:hypothetical protein